MLNNVDLDNDKPGMEPICLWSKDKKSYTCSQADIMELLSPIINRDIGLIREACLGIIEAGPTDFIVVGEGSMIRGIASRLRKELNSEVITYLPNTLGARDGALVALLGAFYNHIDMRQWQMPSVQEEEVVESEVEPVNKPKDIRITNRLKKILNQSHDGGELDE